MILNAIPTNLRYAISAGIGMFIAFIGLKNANIIVNNDATLVGLGAFTPTCILGIIAIYSVVRSWQETSKALCSGVSSSQQL